MRPVRRARTRRGRRRKKGQIASSASSAEASAASCWPSAALPEAQVVERSWRGRARTPPARRRRQLAVAVDGLLCGSASAASCRPSALWSTLRLFRLAARFWQERLLAAHAAASLRRMSTASCVEASAASRCLERALPIAEVVEADCEIGQERLRPRRRQGAVAADGLLRGSQRRLARCPSALCPLPRLLRLIARSGRNVSGRAAASLRRMLAPSCAEASAASRCPRLAVHHAQVVEAHGKAGQERIQSRHRQLTIDIGALLRGKSAPARVARACSASCPG